MENTDNTLQCTISQSEELSTLDHFARIWSVFITAVFVAHVIFRWIRNTQQQNGTSNKYGEIPKSEDIQTYKSLYEQEKNAKEKALQRLSRAMANKLTDGNPNIANLSDENRPTKLSEQFSELYDNAWTNAYESIPDKPEEEKTEFLKLLLQESFKWCEGRSALQLRQLLTVLLAPGMKSDNVDGFSFNKDFMKIFKDERKEIAKLSAGTLASDAISDIKGNIRSSPFKRETWREPVEVYCKQCVVLCWMMVVQDPPLFIDFSTKDSSLYRAYTKTGKVVDFVVWPPLFLCEGGSLMGKGIAQFK